ncbi:MAG: hypothetical protein WDA16_13740 [Candidatus Thermoplasmatota archaeon]
MTKKLLNAQRLVLLAAISVSLVFASPAQANALVLRAEATPEIHCVVEVNSDQSSTPEIAGVPTCYPTFAAAIYAATAETVLLAEDFSSKELTDEILANAPEDHTVIGVSYTGSGYTGSTLTWIGHGNCGWFTSYSASSMPSGWDNVVSSAIEYAGCATNPYYENTDFGGSNIDCTCSIMGVMDNQASSVKWSS